MDFIVSGFTRAEPVEAFTKIYQNDLIQSGFFQNNQTFPPSQLTAITNGNTVMLSWKMPEEDEKGNLSSNIVLEDIDRGLFTISPMASLESGQRLIVSMGNAQLNTNWYLADLPRGQYRWATQSINTSYLGSEFSEFQYFEIESNTSLPNVITPNEDGFNDTFEINLGAESISIEIFNR